jgi:uncharacterized membrane protein YfhO
MWIRSQNKEKMMKVEEIYIALTNKQFRIYSDEVFLGEYKTKERALEVLDEIHEYIENEYMTNKTKENITRMFIANEISFETFEEKLNKLKTVYEMPKE